jgi:hypothetical protein
LLGQNGCGWLGNILRNHCCFPFRPALQSA